MELDYVELLHFSEEVVPHMNMSYGDAHYMTMCLFLFVYRHAKWHKAKSDTSGM